MRSSSFLTAFAFATAVHASAAETAWPAAISGHVAPRPGEHPRLFFRVADVPKLRKRAQTPEGRVIIERCKQLLDGATVARTEKGKFTLWDGAAFGFLYQVTGDETYAELARQSVEHAWKQGVVDRDDRYSLNPPNEPMRFGPSLSAVAIAYDLCYGAWPSAFREGQATRMQSHSAKCKKRGGQISLERMATAADNPNIVSNHFALQVGAAGLTLLAIDGDPGTDPAKTRAWLQGVDRQARKIMTEDFGETGYFSEGPGPGVIANTWTFTPWLLAERVCGGRDWLSPRPHGLAAEWMSLKFVFQAMVFDGKPMYPNPTPNGGYGTEWIQQNGGHHATAFCQGFGAIQASRVPAMKWVYENTVRPLEASQYPSLVEPGKPTFDIFVYPHRALFAFVNWPFDQPAENPERSIPKAIGDRHQGHFLFRNRWQDADDILVSVLFGHRDAEKPPRVMVWGLGMRMTFCNMPGALAGNPKLGRISEVKAWRPAADGSGIVAVGTNAVAVDFSKSSGADAVVVVTGDGADGALTGGGTKARAATVVMGGRTFALLTLGSGTHPEPRVEGERIVLGGQSIGFDGTAITFAKMSGPPTVVQ